MGNNQDILDDIKETENIVKECDKLYDELQEAINIERIMEE